VCPSCAAEHERTERFCRDCGLPLVLSGEEPGEDLSEARERARKVLPRYSEGPLVKVGSARNQAEAEMLENLLLEEGIPSLVRRSGGFDVPDFLAAGPRDILVPASGSELAREILGVPATPDPPAFGEGTPAWVKALAVALAVALVAVIAAGVFAAVF
jgi:Putative prokaryotic signal transducing protein